MSEWEKIETAPKDGRPLLVSDGQPFVVRWNGSRFLTVDGQPVNYARYWHPINPPQESLHFW